MPAPPPPTATLDGVQLLRAAAATLIVVGHTQTALALLAPSQGGAYARWNVLPWGASVDLFFVISGFIMVHASRSLFGAAGGWRTFLRRRVARIAPLYWLATTLYLALLAAAALKGGAAFPGWRALAASYLFLPFAAPGGSAMPVFDLGWTLNYEMFFYAVFACTLWARRGRAVLLLLGAMGGLVAAGALFRPADPALRFWTSPILLDFALGAAVAQLRQGGLRWPTWARGAALLLGAALLVLEPLRVFSTGVGVTVANDWPRVAAAGVPCAVILAAVVLGPDWRPRALRPAVVLGDASYALYLVHPFALILMEKAVVKLALWPRLGGGVLAVATVALAVAMALAVFRFVERPLTEAVRRGLARLAPARVAAGAAA